MKTSIFIRSYHKDFDWLAYCLASIRKYCRGFEETVIVVPADSIRQLKQFQLKGEKTFSCVNHPNGYLHQQVTKLYADTYVKGDYILFVDSDCVFTQEVTPETYFSDGKPVMLITPYSELGASVPWQPITEKALGFPCPFETMRRIPWICRKDLLEQVRIHMANLHDCAANEYVMAQPNRAFSEFNVLGSYALTHYSPEYYKFLDTTKEPLPPLTAIQHWSWGGISDQLRDELKRIIS